MEAASEEDGGPSLRQLLLSGEAAVQQLPTLSAMSEEYKVQGSSRPPP